MESATFQKWLAERGCRFDTEKEKRGIGHATVTVHYKGRTTEVPLSGPRQRLDTEIISRACEELGLTLPDIPEARRPKIKRDNAKR